MGEIDRFASAIDDQAKQDGVARSQAWLHENALKSHLTEEEEGDVIIELQAAHGQYLFAAIELGT